MKNLMLKWIAFFLLCVVTIMPGAAQTNKPLQYGLILGINLSDFYNGNIVSDLNAGFNAGGFVRLPVTETLCIEPELYLSTKGSSVTSKVMQEVRTYNLNLTYLEMPVVGVLNITRLVNLQFGPYVSYLLNAQIKNVGNLNIFNFDQNLNSGNYNGLDAGLVVGIGLDVKSITMGMRYNLGLIRVGKNQQFLGPNYNLSDTKNGVLNFYLTIGFNQKNLNN
jgi:hypothetical protein